MLPYADRFVPEIWLDGRAQDNPALVPFSSGPGICPGRDLVLFSTAMMLANLSQGHRFQLDPPGKLGPLTPIPATLDNFGLRFTVA
jgi:cytochrome P450